MRRVYTLGYNSSSLADIAQYLTQLEACLVDVRQRAASRNPDWSKSRLSATFRDSYYHLPGFGNANYKNGGPIQLSNPESALTQLLAIMESGWPSCRMPILMCACWSWRDCHRTAAARFVVERRFEDDAEEMEVIHLPGKIAAYNGGQFWTGTDFNGQTASIPTPPQPPKQDDGPAQLSLFVL